MIDVFSPDYRRHPGREGDPAGCYRPRDLSAKPLISIVTPLRDTPAPIFGETIRSVLAQTFQQWEWIVVDDGSLRRDAFATLSERLAHDPRLVLHSHDTPLGPGAARNTGYRAARSDYVFQLDSDDVIEPTCLEKLLWCLASRPDCAMVSSYTVGFSALEYLCPHAFDRGVHFLDDNSASVMALVRREAAELVGGHDESNREGFEDWELWLKFADRGMWGETVREYLAWYRRGDYRGKWGNWDDGERMARFREQLRHRFGRLREGFPRAGAAAPRWPASVSELCGSNRLERAPRAALLVAQSWQRTSDGENIASLLDRWHRDGYRITAVSTSTADTVLLAPLSTCTPDLFVLPNFLAPRQYAAFVRYLLASRTPDVTHGGLTSAGDGCSDPRLERGYPSRR